MSRAQKKIITAIVEETAAPSSDGADVTKTTTAKEVSSIPSNIIKLVAKELPPSVTKKDMTQKDIKAVCESFLSVLVKAVKAGESVSFTNKMTFKRVHRGARVHKNPKTGEEIHKEAHYVMSMDIKPFLKREFEAIPIVAENNNNNNNNTPDESSASSDEK